MADPFAEFARKLQQQLTSPERYAPAFPDIEQVIRSSIEENFRVGGRFGNANPWGGGTERWAPVKSDDPGKRILVDEADMLNSIDVRVEILGGEIVISLISRPFYSRFHMEGTSRMPARPFLVLQDKDVQQIVRILLEKYL